MRRGDSTAHIHMDAVNKKTMKQYFALLKDVLDEFNLLSTPAQIYNVDESGVPLDFKTPNVVAPIGAKKVRYRQSGKKGQITIVACANAIGNAIPPMIIYDAKKLGLLMKSLDLDMELQITAGSIQICLRVGW